MFLIIRPDGTVEERAPANGHTWTLEEIYALLSEGGAPTGYIEIVPVRDGKRILLVNEDGKRYRLPRNTLATALVRFASLSEIVQFIAEVKKKGMHVHIDPEVLRTQDYIAGTAIVCTFADLE